MHKVPLRTFAVGGSWRHGSEYVPSRTLKHLNNAEVPFCADWETVDVQGTLYLMLLQSKWAKSWAQAKLLSATASRKITQKSEIILKQNLQLCYVILSPAFLILPFFFFFFNLLIAKKVEALSLPPQIHFAKINDITLCRTETAAITRMVTVCGMCCRWWWIWS